MVKVIPTSSSSSTTRDDGDFGSAGVSVKRVTSSSGSHGPHPGESELAVDERLGSFSPQSHVYFDGIHWANPRETYAQFVSRLRTGDLQDFWWLFPKTLIDELERSSLQGSTASFTQAVEMGTIHVKMHKHEAWRRKLFDTEVGAPNPENGLTAGVVTLGELEGGVFLRVDNRKGSRSMSYLRSRWRGVSLFYSFQSSQGRSR